MSLSKNAIIDIEIFLKNVMYLNYFIFLLEVYILYKVLT